MPGLCLAFALAVVVKLSLPLDVARIGSHEGIGGKIKARIGQGPVGIGHGRAHGGGWSHGRCHLRRHRVHLGFHCGHNAGVSCLSNVRIARSWGIDALLSAGTASTTGRDLEVTPGLGSGALVAAFLSIERRLCERPGLSCEMSSEQVITSKDLAAVGARKALR